MEKEEKDIVEDDDKTVSESDSLEKEHTCCVSTILA